MREEGKRGEREERKRVNKSTVVIYRLPVNTSGAKT